MTATNDTPADAVTRSQTSPLCTPPHLLAQFSAPLPSRLYSRQYAALYDFRLRKLRRGRLLARAKARWKVQAQAQGKDAAAKPTHTPRILDVKPGTVTYVTGIVYAEMRLKPDVLQDLTREQYLPPLPPVTSYADPSSDSIYLEDESGRLELVGPLFSTSAARAQFVTGTVGAFLGTELENGQFHVQDVCWPGLPARKRGGTRGLSNGKEAKRVKLDGDGQERPDDADDDNDDYVVLLSGLDLGSAGGEAAAEEGHADLGFAQSEMRLAMLTEWISGEVGDAQHRKRASHIVGVLIAGNLMSVQRPDGSLFYAPGGDSVPSTGSDLSSSSGPKSSSAQMGTKASRAAKEASSRAATALHPSPPSVLLAHLQPLAATLPVVLMPGATDPASAALPQQAVHRAVLSGVGKWTTDEGEELEQVRGGIQLYNNPSWLQFGATRLLATSGQNLDDLMKYLPREAEEQSSDGAKVVDADDEDEVIGPTQFSRHDASQGGVEQQDDDDALSRDPRLQAARRLLSYGHIAPTCPDTLWCFPFTDRDPFILEDDGGPGSDGGGGPPDVFVVGNQPAFKTCVYTESSSSSSSPGSEQQDERGTRIVLLPRFSVTGEVGLLNLRTRQVRRIKVGWEL